MKLEEFEKLSIEYKTELISEIGNLVDERVIYGKYQIKIYELGKFFVEVWINAKSLQIEKIETLKEDQQWQGYLESIKLTDLY